MNALMTFAAATCAIAYIGAIMWMGGCIQDWALHNGYPVILLPWVFSCIFVVAIPLAIAVQVLS